MKLKVSLKELAMLLQTSLEPPTSHLRNRRTDLTWPKLHLAQESSAQQDTFVQAIHLDILFQCFIGFLHRTRMFVRWMNGTCIETPPQHAEGEDEPVVFSFFTDISANPAIIDLVTTLSKSVQNTLGNLNKHLTRWRRYRLLWKLDKVCNDIWI